MKDVISVDSNSKSEDTTIQDIVDGTPKGQAAVKKAIEDSIEVQNEMIKKAQDTSLDDMYSKAELEGELYRIFTDLRIDLEHEKPGDVYVKYADEITSLLAQQQANLLQVIEDEVIEISSNPRIYNGHEVRARDDLKDEQRQTLKQIKDNVINGGSL